MSGAKDALPPHVTETVRALAEMQAEHHRNASPPLRLLRTITAQLSRPAALAAFTLFSAVWIAANVFLEAAHRAPFDAPPFYVLDTILTVTTVATTLVILSTQQHENRLSENRAQLTLELAILSDQKLAKLIEMLDGLRRDLPNVRTLRDPEAAAFAAATDPEAMLGALEESRRAAHEAIDEA